MDFNHDTYMNKEVIAFICNMTEPISEEEYAHFKAIFESLDAIERIIEFGLSNGYTFAPLTMNSPDVHQKVNN